MKSSTALNKYWIASIIAATIGIIVFLIVAFWPDTAKALIYADQQGAKPHLRQNQELSDRDIVEAIEKKITYDGINVKDLKVYVTSAIVTLDGTVESLGDRLHINRLAMGIRDVRGIVNQLEIAESKRTDQELKNSIVRRLKRNSATDSFQIEVDASDGEVVLEGTVDSFAEKLLARNVAEEVRGVKSVESRLKFNIPQNRTDRDIREEVLARIRNDIWIDEQHLNVTVQDGEITIAGAVGDSPRKEKLNRLAMVAGVRSIELENVTIDPKLSIVPKKKSSLRIDSVIHDALVDSLRLDPRVNAKTIEIDLKQGVVVLRGTVDNIQSKTAAGESARNVIGVANVINKLEVSLSEKREDSTVEQELKEEIADTATLKFDGIQFSVVSGVVTLSGTVPSQYQRRRAEAVAISLKGVVEVNNKIVINNPRAGRSDFDISLDIERAMRWSPYLNITKLKYDVSEGVVVFRGTVHDLQSLDLARAMAIDAGARDIRTIEVTIE